MRRRRVEKFVDRESVEKIREKILQLAQEDSTLIPHQATEEIKTNDWPVIRFLLKHNGNVEKAYHNLVETLKWTVTMDFYNIEPNYFPQEIYKAGGFFLYETDNANCPTLYVRASMVRRVDEFKPTFIKYGLYTAWTLDRAVNGKGWVAIADFKDAGLRNVDLDYIRVAISALIHNFPYGLEYILVVDLPWILRKFWVLIRMWIPEDKRDLIQFASRDQLTEFVPLEKLPDFMGGTCKTPYRGDAVVPKGSPSAVEFASEKLGLDEERAIELISVFDEYL